MSRQRMVVVLLLFAVSILQSKTALVLPGGVPRGVALHQLLGSNLRKDIVVRVRLFESTLHGVVGDNGAA
jgi:hypothetical protein